MPSPNHVQEYDKGWQYENGGEGTSASASSAGRKGIGKAHFILLANADD
jgi:hypothetical protein